MQAAPDTEGIALQPSTSSVRLRLFRHKRSSESARSWSSTPLLHAQRAVPAKLTWPARSVTNDVAPRGCDLLGFFAQGWRARVCNGPAAVRAWQSAVCCELVCSRMRRSRRRAVGGGEHARVQRGRRGSARWRCVFATLPTTRSPKSCVSSGTAGSALGSLRETVERRLSGAFASPR